MKSSKNEKFERSTQNGSNSQWSLKGNPSNPSPPPNLPPPHLPPFLKSTGGAPQDPQARRGFAFEREGSWTIDQTNGCCSRWRNCARMPSPAPDPILYYESYAYYESHMWPMLWIQIFSLLTARSSPITLKRPHSYDTCNFELYLVCTLTTPHVVAAMISGANKQHDMMSVFEPEKKTAFNAVFFLVG